MVGFFKSFRGLRQGDPISPGLFILFAEVLSRGFKALISHNICHPFTLSRGCPIISHLLYADGTLLLTNGSKDLLLPTKRFLDSFQASSGQCISLSKSSFFYSKRIPPSRVRSIESILGFGKSVASFSYLGIPLAEGRMKSSAFKPLVDRVVGRINGWQARILSQAGRAVLVKHILCAIPVHSLAAIHLPSQVLALLERHLANFFWGWSNGKRKLHWVK
ncbi:uncharacterized protein LOC131252119 [Magnolia sinica]|uniref:uncharacterized protein LOC131252119 n=1 Tax=Magnolia sinica TaxID=86752 RepID=UPI00265A1AD4|nr:uncharacterized protein LOC131252119 [Magnolia sinica]